MVSFWNWAWRRHGTRYSWVVYGAAVVVLLPVLLLATIVVLVVDGSDRYAAGGLLALGVTAAAMSVAVLPGVGAWRRIEGWARGDRSDPAGTLAASYAYCRGTVPRAIVVFTATGVLLLVAAGEMGGATGGRLVQHGVLGGALHLGVVLIAVHSFVDTGHRPIRIEVAAGSSIGDALPRERPSFATWSNIAVLGVAFVFTTAGALLAAAHGGLREDPAVGALIAFGMTAAFAAPITLASSFTPSLEPLRDLAAATERVRLGDFSTPLPVAQDDDLGVLAASFNRMQAGLAERRRLEAAFGSYVDPALAARLLGQGDDVFAGERIEVTVLFVDIRDFTTYAEAHEAEETVARLNALFEIVVPTVRELGGHVNKFLGDGALVVFGAPDRMDGHADAAVAAAQAIQHAVRERFGGSMRVGIGINSGTVIAGTIGAGGKLEFTLIGDVVNVAARVEQQTKLTGDATLLTDATRLALRRPLPGLADRDDHELKGKAAPVRLHALPD